MKQVFVALVAALLSVAGALIANAQSTPDTEELMRMYGATDEYFEMQRKIDEINRQSEATKEQEKTTRTIMVVLSLAVALVPVVTIGKQIIDHPETRTAKGVSSALTVAIAGGAVLFAVNYGWMYLRLKAGSALHFPMALLITLGIAVLAIVMMTKKDKN